MPAIINTSAMGADLRSNLKKIDKKMPRRVRYKDQEDYDQKELLHLIKQVKHLLNDKQEKELKERIKSPDLAQGYYNIICNISYI